MVKLWVIPLRRGPPKTKVTEEHQPLPRSTNHFRGGAPATSKEEHQPLPRRSTSHFQARALSSGELRDRPLVSETGKKWDTLGATLSPPSDCLKSAGAIQVTAKVATGRKDAKLLRRAWHRKYTGKIRKLLMGMTLGQGMLADLSVKPATLKDYLTRLGDLWGYLGDNGVPFETVQEKDVGLTKYANHLAGEGELCGEGQKLKAAFEALEPDFAKAGAFGLPRLCRALKGWEKLAPTQGRLAIPESVLDLMTDELLATGRAEEALYLQVNFSCYLRPSESHRLCLADVVPPVKGAGREGDHVSLILAPFERGIWTKTRQFDEAIILDDVRCQWLGQALLQHVQSRRRVLRGRGVVIQEDLDEGALWSFGQGEMLVVVKALGKQFGMENLVKSLYNLRHGGASRDTLMKLRGLAEVMRRGRWAHLESVRHYEKHGRVTKTLSALPRGLIERGTRAHSTFGLRFRASL